MEYSRIVTRPLWRFWWTKEEKKQNLFNKGFDCAAGRILSDGNTRRVEQHVDCSEHFGDFDEFDRGAITAIKRFKQILKGETDGK